MRAADTTSPILSTAEGAGSHNQSVVTIPAFVWRGGSVPRVVIIGGCAGLVSGALAWLDSGVPAVGGIVLTVVGVFYGTWMARRMARYWPQSRSLTGEQRVEVVRAARRGDRIGDPRLAEDVRAYARGLHAAAREARPLRWLLVIVLVVASGVAVWDAVFGSWGNAVASAIYLVALMFELFWWPKRQQSLLINADRAATAL